MDEFFASLDCRLRVSGVVADSIMMGIVNSAMEEAFKKVCSKEGDLECLTEKSRFCQLAVMQLEWCLKFVQEVMDSCMVESSQERENLVLDLTDTRDRMQKRLEETKHAISEKDRELTDRLKNEVKLRETLELKDEELCILRANLELERTKSQQVRQFLISNCIRGGKNSGRDFCKMKNSVDQQFSNIKQKLGDGYAHLMDGMQKNDCSSTDPVKVDSRLKLREEKNYYLPDMNVSDKSKEAQNDGQKELGLCENDNNSEVEVSDSFPRIELNTTVEQMGMDIDVLKEMLEVAFEMMDSSIFSSKVALMEEQWERTAEKEIVAFVLQSFLREVRENFDRNSLSRNSRPLCFSSGNWLALMDDVTSLRHELELLVAPNEVQSKCATVHEFGTLSMRGHSVKTLKRCVKSDASSRFEELQHSLQDSPKEDMAGHPHHHVAEMIRSHEHIIKKKTEEINQLKGEILKEKESPLFRKDKSPDTVKKVIPNKGSHSDMLERCAKSDDASLRFEELCYLESSLKEDTAGHSHHHVAEMIKSHEYMIQKKTEEINWLKGEILREKGCPSSGKDKNLITISRIISEVILKLDSIIKENAKLSAAYDDSRYVHRPVEGLQTDLDNVTIENLMRNDIFTVLFRELFKEWKNEIESSSIENLIQEDIFRIVLNEIFKDIEYTINFTLIECQDSRSQVSFLEDLLSSNMRGLDSMPNTYEAEDDLMLNGNSELMQQHRHIDFADQEPNESDDYNVQCQGMFSDVDDAFISVSSKLEKALQQIIETKSELKVLGSRLGIVVGGWKEAHELEGIIEEGKNTQSLANGEKQWIEFDSVVSLLTYFSEVIMSFEHLTHEKLGVITARLETINHQVDPLIQHISSLARKELLYRQAFTRRCCDLQMAEAEVDLLGDEVDMLLGLLEKTYVILDQHSSVLQNCSGIMDILKLIRKKLNGEAPLTANH